MSKLTCKCPFCISNVFIRLHFLLRKDKYILQGSKPVKTVMHNSSHFSYLWACECLVVSVCLNRKDVMSGLKKSLLNIWCCGRGATRHKETFCMDLHSWWKEGNGMKSDCEWEPVWMQHTATGWKKMKCPEIKTRHYYR